jgi:hypothetical protein
VSWPCPAGHSRYQRKGLTSNFRQLLSTRFCKAQLFRSRFYPSTSNKGHLRGCHQAIHNPFDLPQENIHRRGYTLEQAARTTICEYSTSSLMSPAGCRAVRRASAGVAGRKYGNKNKERTTKENPGNLSAFTASNYLFLCAAFWIISNQERL